MITLTPTSWTVRCGPSHAQYGDPYEGVATVQRRGDVEHVGAACGKLPIADQVELSRMLREMGFVAIVFERVLDGKIVQVRRELRKPGAKLKPKSGAKLKPKSGAKLTDKNEENVYAL